MSEKLQDHSAQKPSGSTATADAEGVPGAAGAPPSAPPAAGSASPRGGGPGAAVKNLHIMGLPFTVFLALFAVTAIGLYTDLLPMNFMSGLAIAMLLGGALMKIGNAIPVFGTFGGGPILCILIPAVLAFSGLVPENFATITDGFYNDIGFAELVVCGLIVGSLLSMDRKMLLKTGPRFFVPLLGGVIVTMLLIGGLGALLGFGFVDALFFVVGPIMGGGMAAGAVPMSEIYAARTGQDPAYFLALLAPAVMVGNMVCVLVAGVLNGLGKTRPNLFPGFNGRGQLLRSTGSAQTDVGGNENATRTLDETISRLGIGLVLAAGFFVFGELMGAVVPSLHPYVWIILGAAALKISGVLPERVEGAAADWYTFISKVWVPAVLVTISAGMIDFAAVIEIVTDPRYFALIVGTVLIAAVMAGVLGLLVRFHFIESSIAAGLGMADMGGSGDVAVLSASERMELMPFLQISSRIGGAIVIIILSVAGSFLL
jgi:malate:Na+ symporter